MSGKFRRIVSRDSYVVVSGLAADVAKAAPENDLAFVSIGTETAGLVLRSRPDYERTLAYYLRTGHRGIGIRVGDELAALAWYFINESHKEVRAKGYFPLASEDAYLHADWTADSYRGRGFHKALIRARAAAVEIASPGARLYANMSRSNEVSHRNYLSCGFVEVGTLEVRTIGGRALPSSVRRRS